MLWTGVALILVAAWFLFGYEDGKIQIAGSPPDRKPAKTAEAISPQTAVKNAVTGSGGPPIEDGETSWAFWMYRAAKLSRTEDDIRFLVDASKFQKAGLGEEAAGICQEVLTKALLDFWTASRPSISYKGTCSILEYAPEPDSTLRQRITEELGSRLRAEWKGNYRQEIVDAIVEGAGWNLLFRDYGNHLLRVTVQENVKKKYVWVKEELFGDKGDKGEAKRTFESLPAGFHDSFHKLPMPYSLGTKIETVLPER